MAENLVPRQLGFFFETMPGMEKTWKRVAMSNDCLGIKCPVFAEKIVPCVRIYAFAGLQEEFEKTRSKYSGRVANCEMMSYAWLCFVCGSVCRL